MGRRRTIPFIRDNLDISEALLRAVIATAVDGIMVIDDRGVVRLYNEACERLFGYAADEVVGRNVRMLMPQPYRDEHDGYIESYTRTGEARIIGIGREVTGERKDGSRFPIGLSVGEVRHRDRRLFVGIVHDITEQKLSEEKLRTAKEEAESANRAKSDFLAVMSHEIRTPLHGILGTASLLRHTELGEKQSRYVGTIQQSCDALLEIVDNILDLARIESGAVVVNETRCEIEGLLESVGSLWESRVRERDLDYFTKVGHDVPRAVKFDAERIREILNNLVSNAVKFTEDGYVAVQVGLDGKPDGEDDKGLVLRFEVSDTGIGIDPAQQERLFQRFEQGDSSLTRERGGSGLGLAICKELCQLLGGEIGVVSEPGIGSRFWFTVPCRAADRDSKARTALAGTPAPDRSPVETDRLTVLVAEDNPNTQMIIRDILECGGHAVDVAANGREAVRAALHGRYDLILMDLRMPVMDGIEATRIIRQRLPEPPHVHIVALTAHAMHGVREQCLAAGMDDYISKPFTIAQINEVLARYGKAA